ncbi:hypothetical protein NLG97_g8909 [Lecanicillium saksenae]|uniref:Uncharacterized protein n=1 Tax=Lecanicillium saksenae TaxID=468837 RepID=A0ACC1QKI5_9HYPO|nr:hypothetical protein NLG97_g8909 [Lecanicillium saksenae]
MLRRIQPPGPSISQRIPYKYSHSQDWPTRYLVPASSAGLLSLRRILLSSGPARTPPKPFLQHQTQESVVAATQALAFSLPSSTVAHRFFFFAGCIIPRIFKSPSTSYFQPLSFHHPGPPGLSRSTPRQRPLPEPEWSPVERNTVIPHHPDGTND